MAKYVFFTGGVVSGLGKGITAASLGRLIKARGYDVDVIKFNPYFNMDSSTLSQRLHGETFITADGRACDLLTGHYERIIGMNLSGSNDVTSGEIYSKVIAKERENIYGGQTIQVVPHITDEIKGHVTKASKSGADVYIVEVGGTVGDIEAQPFFEAIRQLRIDLGKNNVAYVHVSLVPFIDVSGEQKTKPTQHSVKELQNLGIQPDVIVCRSEFKLETASRNKLALFCNVDKDCIIENILTDTVYDMPIKLEEEGFCKVILRRLKLEERKAELSKWHQLCQSIEDASRSTDTKRIGIAGAYADRYEAYVSLREALFLSAVNQNKKIEIIGLTDESDKKIKDLDGLMITHSVKGADLGFKLAFAQKAKKLNIPTLLLGDAFILGIDGMNLDLPKGIEAKPSTKLGAHTTTFEQDSFLYKVYGQSAKERHDNTININQSQIENIKDLMIIGKGEQGEISAYQLKEHKLFIGVSFIPEFSAKAESPNPLFCAFLNNL